MKAIKNFSFSGLLISVTLLGSTGTAGALEPYQMVRSLQRLQDQIATGDRYAIGMQKELYKEIRKNFMSPRSAEEQSEQNLIAVLGFVLAGGGPDVLQPFENDFAKNEELRDIAIAVHASAQSGSHLPLAELELRNLDNRLAVPIALVRGLRAEDPKSQVLELNFVRVSMPGTLYEETALRELMKVYREAGNATDFVHVASRYARTFHMSPYSSQFADELNLAAGAFGGKRIGRSLLDILSFVDEPARTALKDRITRTATIKPDNELLGLLESLPTAPGDQNEVAAEQEFTEADRVLLTAYAELSDLSRDEAASSLMELQAIEMSDLHPENRSLHMVVIEGLKALLASPLPTADTLSMQSSLPVSENSETSGDSSSAAHDEFVSRLRGKIGDVDTLLEAIE